MTNIIKLEKVLDGAESSVWVFLDDNPKAVALFTPNSVCFYDDTGRPHFFLNATVLHTTPAGDVVMNVKKDGEVKMEVFKNLELLKTGAGRKAFDFLAIAQQEGGLQYFPNEYAYEVAKYADYVGEI